MKKKSISLIGIFSAITLAFTTVSDFRGKDELTFQLTNTFKMADTTHNHLTAVERSKGWKLLFDGRSMKGWRTYQNKKSDSWSVHNGVLHCKGSESDKSDLRADLITNDQFENFDLSVDWK